VKFVVASAFYSGLGFAIRLQQEGHDVLLAATGPDDRRRSDRYDLVGKGLVPKARLQDVVRDRNRYRDWLFIWDENHSVAENEQLRSDGFRVFGGGRYPDQMEHDRDACAALVRRYGLTPPPSFGFDRAADALRFLDEHPDTAFVFKPDRGETFETWLPTSHDPAQAQEELRQHLKTLQYKGSFLLQERKAGVEANVEAWLVRGEPRFAFMTLESKRKLTGDLGAFCGCAFDFAFVVPLESRAVRETVGRMFPYYRETGYTGFADANIIVADDGIWFLEKCERFGYNAHPNLLWNLNRETLGDTLATLIDGSFTPNFSPGFGASVSVYMDHPEAGKVVSVPDEVARDLYFMDVYREGDALLTAGYNELVLIANGFGLTMREAWKRCVTRAWQVTFPGRAFRTDGADTNYPSAPVRNYEALEALRFI